jgi:hypothetical protein
VTQHDVVRLTSRELDVTIDPFHGGEVTSIVDRKSETEVLWKAPWQRHRLNLAEPLDEASWLSGYGGGWQVLFPNAGNATVHDGRALGFHGPSSVQPWAWDGAALTFVHDDLELVRRPYLDGRTFGFSERVRNTGTRPRSYVSVQHLAFGHGLLAPAVEIVAPVARAERLVEDEALLGSIPDRVVDWPDWSVLSLDKPVARFGCLRMEHSRYRVLNQYRGIGVEVRWSTDMWPYVWYWAEIRATQEAPWEGRAEVLALEPASVPHSLGLEASSRRGEASVIQAGGSAEATIEIELLRA